MKDIAKESCDEVLARTLRSSGRKGPMGRRISHLAGRLYEVCGGFRHELVTSGVGQGLENLSLRLFGVVAEEQGGGLRAASKDGPCHPMTNYLLDVYAAYDPEQGSPQTLASALDSAMIEFDYSLQLRDHSREDAAWERRYIGLFTLDGYDCDEPRDALLEAVEDTDAVRWCISVYEIDPEEGTSFTALAWRDERA